MSVCSSWFIRVRHLVIGVQVFGPFSWKAPLLVISRRLQRLALRYSTRTKRALSLQSFQRYERNSPIPRNTNYRMYSDAWR